MRPFRFIQLWLLKRKVAKKNKEPKLHIARANDVILIQNNKSDSIIRCKVENNLPEEKKIFLSMHFDKEKNTCHSQTVYPYSHEIFKNFNVLNIKNQELISDKSIEEFLEEKLNLAISQENYILAAKLRDAIKMF